MSKVGDRWRQWPLFAVALFGVTKLLESLDKMFNAYAAVCQHRPDINTKTSNEKLQSKNVCIAGWCHMVNSTEFSH